MNYRNFYMDDADNQNNDNQQDNRSNQPTTLLPNPGEGGPVYSGDNNASQPVVPLPNPGEGGPVYSDDNGANQPTILLPNPGEGGPVYSGNTLQNIIGTIISSHPRPNGNCQFCGLGATQIGKIRFLNTASNYNPFLIYFNSALFADSLGFAEMTEYESVPAGYQTVSVVGENGYIYIQKRVQIVRNSTVTMAIINTASGIDLMPIEDTACDNNYQVACIRAVNLSYNSGPLNLVIGQRNVIFQNITYMQVADYKNIWPGTYNYYVTKTGTQQNTNQVILSSVMNIKNNGAYTVYMFNWNRNSTNAIRVLIVEEL